VADASEEESVTEDNEEWLEEEYEEELDDEYSEYDYDEVESEEDTMEYYVSDDNTENNEMTEEEGTEEKENELLTLEMANKEESSSPLPTVKKQSTAIKPPVKKKSSRYVIPFDKSRYTIQIASKKNLNDAEKVAVNLIESGYDAYIQKAYFRDTDEVWFRVRVGSYDNRDTALSVGKVIADAMTTEVWIDFVRFEE
jgi:cell division protein FtsN